MSDIRQAAQQALGTLERCALRLHDPSFVALPIDALRAALAAERERQHEQMRQLMSELIFDEPAAVAEPVASVTECEACFTPDVCQLRGTCDHYAAERLRVAAPPQREPQWQPIETAPKDGRLFLCWVSAIRYGETEEGQRYTEDVSQVDFCNWRTQADIPDCGWFDPCCGQIGDQQGVTHWMPLPDAPKEQP